MWRKHGELSSAFVAGSRLACGAFACCVANMGLWGGVRTRRTGSRGVAGARRLTAVGGRALSRQAWIVVEETLETCLNCLFSFGPLSLLAEAWESEITLNGEPWRRGGLGSVESDPTVSLSLPGVRIRSTKDQTLDPGHLSDELRIRFKT